MTAALLQLVAATGCESVHEAGAPEASTNVGVELDSAVIDSAVIDSTVVDAPPGKGVIQAICEHLQTESDCAAATVACREYALDRPLASPMIDCGTSLPDGALSADALRCVENASAEERPFMLVALDRYGLEGEFSENVWLGLSREGRYERLRISAGGGPLIPTAVQRRSCDAIVSRYSRLICEDAADAEALCPEAEYHWACWPWDTCSTQ